MTDALAIKEDINISIQERIDPATLAEVIYPRIRYALEEAKTPEEISTLRSQIDAVQTYIKNELPKVSKDRKDRFAITFEGDKLYCEASAQLGAMWEIIEKNQGYRNDLELRPMRDEVKFRLDYFSNYNDSMRCVRASKVDPQDRDLYFEDMRIKAQQPTVSGLDRLWRKLNREEQEFTVDGKYRVIYADPPWEYGNTMTDDFHEQDDHYPLMTIDELCGLPVKDIAEDNAVLFMWATSPILEESFQVIKAWGFEYKSSFVWDKVKHVMGHYNSVRHEFLLVCTRGSCQPDVFKLFDSVVTIERTEHSLKPDYFREIIDTIYPNGKRIELFARKQVDGWDCYGNEVTANS